MSGAEDELPSGSSPSPFSVLTGTIGFLNKGGDLGTLLQGAFFGILVSVSQGGINLVQSVFNLVVTPLDELATLIGQVIEAFLTDPLSIISTTATTSGNAISEQFGPFALIVGVLVVLASYWLVTRYLEEDETSNVVPAPGLGDIPDIGPIEVGVTEEGEDEEE